MPMRSYQFRLAPALTSRRLPQSVCSPRSEWCMLERAINKLRTELIQATSASAIAPGTTSLTAFSARPRLSRMAHALPGGVDRPGGMSRPGRALTLPARHTQGQGTPEVIPRIPRTAHAGLCATLPPPAFSRPSLGIPSWDGLYLVRHSCFLHGL